MMSNPIPPKDLGLRTCFMEHPTRNALITPLMLWIIVIVNSKPNREAVNATPKKLNTEVADTPKTLSKDELTQLNVLRFKRMQEVRDQISSAQQAASVATMELITAFKRIPMPSLAVPPILEAEPNAEYARAVRICEYRAREEAKRLDRELSAKILALDPEYHKRQDEWANGMNEEEEMARYEALDKSRKDSYTSAARSGCENWVRNNRRENQSPDAGCVCEVRAPSSGYRVLVTCEPKKLSVD